MNASDIMQSVYLGIIIACVVVIFNALVSLVSWALTSLYRLISSTLRHRQQRRLAARETHYGPGVPPIGNKSKYTNSDNPRKRYPGSE